jgi:lipid-binding SYLF domain-containing protein
MSAEILSWSRTKGVFAGIALKGASLRSDEKDNAELYGQPMKNHDILMTPTPVPAAARPLITELDRYSMHKDNADRTQ